MDAARLSVFEPEAVGAAPRAARVIASAETPQSVGARRDEDTAGAGGEGAEKAADSFDATFAMLTRAAAPAEALVALAPTPLRAAASAERSTVAGLDGPAPVAASGAAGAAAGADALRAGVREAAAPASVEISLSSSPSGGDAAARTAASGAAAPQSSALGPSSIPAASVAALPEAPAVAASPAAVTAEVAPRGAAGSAAPAKAAPGSAAGGAALAKAAPGSAAGGAALAKAAPGSAAGSAALAKAAPGSAAAVAGADHDAPAAPPRSGVATGPLAGGVPPTDARPAGSPSPADPAAARSFTAPDRTAPHPAHAGAHAPTPSVAAASRETEPLATVVSVSDAGPTRASGRARADSDLAAAVRGPAREAVGQQVQAAASSAAVPSNTAPPVAAPPVLHPSAATSVAAGAGGQARSLERTGVVPPAGAADAAAEADQAAPAQRASAKQGATPLAPAPTQTVAAAQAADPWRAAGRSMATAQGSSVARVDSMEPALVAGAAEASSVEASLVGAGANGPARGDAPASSPITLAGHPQAQLRTMARAVANARDGDRVELRLDPPELGRVIIDIRIENGVLRADVSAERPETLDLMRRHADTLQRELAAAGFERADLDFSGRRRGAEPAAREGVAATRDAAPDPAPIRAARAPGDRLDIRL